MIDHRASIVLRRATAADKDRILEISSQIWDGDDYVGTVFDDWLADARGEVAVALIEGEIVGFAHLSYLLPGYAWMEGIRTDPARRNKGAARAINDYLVAQAARGADRIGLSTYIDNEASIHIIESSGFTRTASFIYFEAELDAAVRTEGRPSERAAIVSRDEAIEFIRKSEFLAVSNGFLPHGWKFYPFRRDPQASLGWERDLIGIRESGRLAALASVARLPQLDGRLQLNFLDGAAGAVEELTYHVLHLAREARVVEVMVPKNSSREAPCLSVFKHIGFEAWNGFVPDVFVYEMAIAENAP